jgi:clathrin heavy chain
MMFKDAMETARDSSNPELVEALLRYFVENNDAECFCACLYTCYDYVRPDVALELAWRNGLLDYAMPYLIETFREYTSRLDALDKKTTKKEEEEQKNKSASNDYVADYIPPMMGMPGMMGGPLALTAPPVQQQGFGQPGMAYGQPNMPMNPSMMMTPGRF